MAPQKIGDAYYLDEGLYIDAVSDVPMVGGVGGGGPGLGGWGLYDGPRRGEGNGGKRPGLDFTPGFSTILTEEFNGVTTATQQEFAARYNALNATIEQEITAARSRHSAPGGSSYLNLLQQQRGLLEFIEEKRTLAISHLHKELSFWGSPVFYKPPSYFYHRGMEAIRNNDPSYAFIQFPQVLEAAHERKIIDHTLEAAAGHLAELAEALEHEQDLTQLEYAQKIELLAGTIRAIRTEQAFHFQSLPRFLQIELLNHAPQAHDEQGPQLLAQYASALSSLANNRLLASASFAQANPNITSPLTSSELEALNSLILGQRNNSIGPRWLDYHQSLLNQESARVLKQTKVAFAQLNARAQRVALLQAEADRHETMRQEAESRQRAEALRQQQLQAEHKARERAQQQVLAEEKAREVMRIQAEMQRQRISYNAFSHAASPLPQVTAVGATTLTVAQGTYATLLVAIREAVTSLAAAATPAMGNLLVASLTMMWPSTLGNAERRYLLSTPLSSLAPAGGPDLEALASRSVSLDLPYLLAGAEDENGLDLYVVPGGKPVAVRAATFDSKRQVYSLALENPQRVLTWTPASAPGGNEGNSTSYPSVPPGTLVYGGSRLDPVSSEPESYPALDLLDQERLIITFPTDSGLPPILVVFKSPRFEPGAAIGSSVEVSGLWPGEAARAEGAPVPAQIADQLRGTEFRNFNRFRRGFWKAVAHDAELSKQFSERNLRRMRKHGNAPTVGDADIHMSQLTYILHHVLPISEGGDVYDMNNIRIVTPRAHHSIHYGERK
ncbi:S-type pyocin domain-containing protein [Pseudomonas sp. microsymbiont 2]